MIQNPATIDESLYSAITTCVQQQIKKLRVATYGKVVEVNSSKKTVNVAPLVKESINLPNGTVAEVVLPVLVNVPYLSNMSTPKVGDKCICIHLDKNINTGEDVYGYVNTSRQTHELSNAIMIGVL